MGHRDQEVPSCGPAQRHGEQAGAQAADVGAEDDRREHGDEGVAFEQALAREAEADRRRHDDRGGAVGAGAPARDGRALVHFLYQVPAIASASSVASTGFASTLAPGTAEPMRPIIGAVAWGVTKITAAAV